MKITFTRKKKLFDDSYYYAIFKDGFIMHTTEDIREVLYYKPKKSICGDLRDFLAVNDCYSIIDDLENSENGNDYFNFSITCPSKIAYLKADRIPENNQLIWDNEYRKSKAFHCRIGKVLSDELKTKHNEQIQKVSAKLSNRALKNTKLFLTDDICKYYLEDNYSDVMGTKGDLGNSCMRADYLQDAIRLYEKFGSDNVQLLVLTDNDDKVLGRALYWHKVKHDDKITPYMDRVYAVNSNIAHLFYDYAKNKDIPYYNDGNCRTRMQVDVNIDVCKDAVPYFDTFTYYCECKGLNNSTGDYSLDSTEGNTLEDNNEYMCTCDDCGTRYDSENEGGYCDNNGEYYCSECGVWTGDEFLHQSDAVSINGDWYNKEDDNICYSEYHNEYFLQDDVVYSEYHNDYLSNDEAVHSEHHEDYFLPDDVVKVEHDYDYYMLDDDNIVQINDVYYHKEDDNIALVNGTYYLADDEAIYYDEITGEYKPSQITMKI